MEKLKFRNRSFHIHVNYPIWKRTLYFTYNILLVCKLIVYFIAVLSKVFSGNVVYMNL